MPHPDLDHALSNELADVSAVSIDQLRQWRPLLTSVEEQMSYVRRIAQSRSDLVRSELTERAAGKSRSDLTDIIRRLPEVLAEHGSADGEAGVAAPDIDVDPEYSVDLDAVVAPIRLLEVGSFSRGELRELVMKLEAIEARISVQRRLVQARADSVEEEIARREDIVVAN